MVGVVQDVLMDPDGFFENRVSEPWLLSVILIAVAWSLGARSPGPSCFNTIPIHSLSHSISGLCCASSYPFDRLLAGVCRVLVGIVVDSATARDPWTSLSGSGTVGFRYSLHGGSQ